MERLLYTITDQAIGLRRDTGRLLVAQHWTGFSGHRHAFTLSINDKITGQRAGTARQVAEDFRRAAAALAPLAITEEQARDHLKRIGRPRQRVCAECAAGLPLGGLYCLQCGLNQTVPVANQPLRLVRLP